MENPICLKRVIQSGTSFLLLPAGKLGRSDSQIGRSYSAKLRHFLSIYKQISHYTYYCHLMEGETRFSGSRLSDNVTTACICVVTEWK